jgi:tetratricopeptide (TPR) repeat protein
MRSCTFLFYIAVALAPGVLSAQDDADALYRNRATIADARRAAEIWEAQLKASPSRFDALWKLARVAYWLGKHEDTQGKRRSALERGVAAGRQASEIQPGRGEGYFWMAANMGTLAESYGLSQGLKYRGEIKEALEMVLRVDPAFQQGSADRALGRWYFKVPGLFGGSNKKSEEHLRRSLTFNPDSTVSRFYLAETLLDLDREREAVEELKKVQAAPVDADWEPEDREYKQMAAELLAKLQR